MKLADKILNRVNEKVGNQFFDDAEAMARGILDLKKKVQNKDLGDVLNLIVSFLESLDEVDEKQALKDLDSLKKFIKDLQIEK